MADEIEQEDDGRMPELQNTALANLVAAFSTPLLSDTTRRSRKMLMLSSSIILIMVWVGIVPTEIAAIGVKFEPSGQLSLVASGGLVVLYFLALYFVQLRNDNENSSAREKAARQAAKNANIKVSEIIFEPIGPYGRSLIYPGNQYFLIDQILPIAIGVVAIISALYFIITKLGYF